MAAPDLKALGRYTIQRVLGRGAMGVVYEGLDPKLNRRVAIKTILRSHLDEATAQSFAERFVQEAHAVARLNHPHIVQVHDFGEEGDIAYLVMEFIRGRELQSYFNAGERFDVKEAVRIMSELASALEFAHQAGIIHRDVKPANVMLDSQGHTKLTDFGVARVQDITRSHATQAGTLVGTPAYMSPEQITGAGVDRRTDVFAAGIILYQFLTGELPFSGGGPWTIAKKIMQDQPAVPSSVNTMVSPMFDAVAGKALAKEPERRYQSMRAFAVALKRALEGKSEEDDSDRTVVYPAARAPAPAAPAAPAARTPTGSTQPGTQDAEVEFWRSIKDSTEADDYELYLKKFPDGLYAELARRKMSRLGGAEQARREAQAKADVEARAREVEENARREAEEEAKRLAAERAKADAEQTRRAAEAKARLEAQAEAERQAAERARLETELRRKRAAEEKLRVEAEEKRRAAEEKVKLDAEALLRKQQARKAQAAAEQAIAANPEDRGGRSRPIAIGSAIVIGLAIAGAGLWYATRGRAPERPQAGVEPSAEQAAAAQKQAAERAAADKAAADKLAADKAAVEKLMAEARAAAEKAVAERVAAQKAVADLAAAERAASDRAAAARLAGERAAAERVAAEKATAERRAAAERAAAEKLAAEQAAAARLAAERSAAERAAADKAAAARAAAEKAKAEQAKPPVAAAASPLPQVGDRWTYHFTQPGQRQRLYTVDVTAASSGTVSDSYAIEGGASGTARHERGSYLAALGPALFSPYLAAFEEPAAGARLGRITVRDGACPAIYLCYADARVVGRETVKVPAGSFDAVKVSVEQSWRAASGAGGDVRSAGQMNGSRILTIWYAPAVKRAVRYSSRLSYGDVPAVDSNFDLELVGYQPAGAQRAAAGPPKTEPTQVAATAASSPLPRAGDSWTYRLSQKGTAPQRYTVNVTAASSGTISDSYAIEGGASGVTRHERGSYLAALGPALFSPYLAVFEEFAAGARLGRITVRDGACPVVYLCYADGRVVGRETVQVPAGSFDAIKVSVEQSWRAAGSGSIDLRAGGQMSGSRILTIWYAPAAKRAVKFSSRLSIGDLPPVDSNFDLELVGYKLQ